MNSSKILGGCFALALLISPVLATESPKSQNPSKKVVFVPRRGKGLPMASVGAGTRGNCASSATAALQLVVPLGAPNLTAKAHPTFFFYVPVNTTQVEFSLYKTTPNVLGESRTGIYQVKLPVKAHSIAAFVLPSEAPSLEVGKTYDWSVAQICDPLRRQRDVVLANTIQRVKADDVPTAGLEAAQALGSQGLWSDTIELLSGANLRQEWQSLVSTYTALPPALEVPISVVR